MQYLIVWVIWVGGEPPGVEDQPLAVASADAVHRPAHHHRPQGGLQYTVIQGYITIISCSKCESYVAENNKLIDNYAQL